MIIARFAQALLLALTLPSFALAQTPFFFANHTPPPQSAAPTFAPVAGTYTGTQSVAISSATSGATICYTADGSTPAAATAGTCSAGTSLANGGTVSVATAKTLKALATKASYVNSSVASAAYTIEYRDGFGSDTIATYTTVGTWSVSGGKLRVTGNTGGWQTASYSPITTQDGVIETQFVLGPNTQYVALYARYVDSNNWVLLSLNVAAGALNVYERKNGTQVGGGSGGTGTSYVTIGAMTTGVTYAIRLEHVGTTLTCKFDQAATATTTRMTWTEPNAAWSGTSQVGAYSGSSAGDATFDNLIISPVSSATF